MNRINRRIQLSIAALRVLWKAGKATRQTYSVDVPTSRSAKGCLCDECVDMVTYSGHAYIVDDWYIVIGHRRKE